MEENINITITRNELLRITLALQTASRVADDRGNKSYGNELLDLYDKLEKYM